MKKNLEIISWYMFDMGNSAHALLISTVGFALYFKEVLFRGNPNGNSAWGILTAFVLGFSAILSPFLTSWLLSRKKRAAGLIVITLICVFATALLSTKLGDSIAWATIIYFFSALGYYLALPIYNCYLPDISQTAKMQKISGAGWALGYLGGILSVGLCWSLGYLKYSAADRPELFRNIFFIAALFNFGFSIPMFFLAYFKDRKASSEPVVKWDFADVIRIFKSETGKPVLRLLIGYWLINEVAVVVTYFFAIFLRQYAGLTEAKILVYSIAGQLLAIVSTSFFGFLSYRIGGKRVLIWIVLAWAFVPIVLYFMSVGLSFWIPVLLLGFVIGAYHAIIRGEVAKISEEFTEPKDKGSLFGFLEVSGRISQVLGPLMIAFVTLFMPLNYGIITMTIFPLIALIILAKYRWK